MKKLIIYTLTLSLFTNLYSLDNFYCSDGPVTIRKEQDLWSDNLGYIEPFETAQVLETGKEYKNGRIKGNWLKINHDGTEGWIYGGYGTILEEKYTVSKPEDFLKVFPDTWKIEETGRNLFVYDPVKIEQEKQEAELARQQALEEKQKKLEEDRKANPEKYRRYGRQNSLDDEKISSPNNNKSSGGNSSTEKTENQKTEESSEIISQQNQTDQQPSAATQSPEKDMSVKTMVRIDYTIKPKFGHKFSLSIFCKPKDQTGGRSLSGKYNLTVKDGDAKFGYDKEYKPHRYEKSVDLEGYYSKILKYYAAGFDQPGKWDVLSFYTDHFNGSDFDGIMINFYGVWHHNEVYDLSELNTEYIENCRNKRIKDSMYFQFILELFKRCEIL